MPTWAFTPESMCEIRCCQRLLGGDDDAGHLCQFLADVGQHLLARPAASSGSKLMMISDMLTPSACSSSSARPVRRPKATTPSILLQALVDHAGDAVGRFQRRARRQQHVDLHAAFVERRQEIAAQLRDDQHADDHGRRDGPQNRPRMPHAEANGEARRAISATAASKPSLSWCMNLACGSSQ